MEGKGLYQTNKGSLFYFGKTTKKRWRQKYRPRLPLYCEIEAARASGKKSLSSQDPLFSSTESLFSDEESSSNETFPSKPESTCVHKAYILEAGDHERIPAGNVCAGDHEKIPAVNVCAGNQSIVDKGAGDRMEATKAENFKTKKIEENVGVQMNTDLVAKPIKTGRKARIRHLKAVEVTNDYHPLMPHEISCYEIPTSSILPSNESVKSNFIDGTTALACEPTAYDVAYAELPLTSSSQRTRKTMCQNLIDNLEKIRLVMAGSLEDESTNEEIATFSVKKYPWLIANDNWPADAKPGKGKVNDIKRYLHGAFNKAFQSRPIPSASETWIEMQVIKRSHYEEETAL